MLTLLNCGQGQQNTINVFALIQAFKIRVFGLTGTYSAEACQTATLNALNNI
jgi:hypothetical protein